MRFERALIFLSGGAGKGRAEKAFRGDVGKALGVGLQHRMIGCRCTQRAEIRPPIFERVDERPVVSYFGSSGFCECRDLRRPFRRGNSKHRIRPERGNDAPAPSRSSNSEMVAQCVRCCVGCCKQLDVETLEETSWEELGGAEFFLNLIVDGERIVPIEFFPDIEKLVQLVLEPDAGGSSAKEIPVPREYLPYLARADSTGFAVAVGNPKGIERDALRVEHPEDVVVGNDQQGGRFRKWLIPGEHTGIDVPVRADERQRPCLLVDLPRRCANGSVGVEEPVVVQLELACLAKRTCRSASDESSSDVSYNLAICS